MELRREELGPIGTPADVLRSLRGDRRPFLLVGDWAGGGAVAGSEPTGCPGTGFTAGSDPVGPADAWSPVGGGWFGYLGFALAPRAEPGLRPPPRPEPLPAADVAWYDHLLRMAPDGIWWFEALVTEARRAALDERLAALRERIGRPEPRSWRLRGMEARAPGHDGHRWAVADAARRIAEGELVHAHVGLRLDGELEGDPLDAFADVTPVLRPSHGAFLGLGGGTAVLSFSQDRFLRAAPTPTDAERVPAAFPPASVTGTPRIEALRAIGALEPTAREVYGGAIGFASPLAGLHLSVATRTLEVRGGRAWLGAGGGVVAGADPGEALEQALGEAQPVVEALGGTVARPAPARGRTVPRRHPEPRPDPACGLLETARVQDGEVELLGCHLRRLAGSAAVTGTALPPDLADRARRAAAAAGPGVHRLRIVVGPGGHVDVATQPASRRPAPARLLPVCIPGGLGAHKWADRRGLSVWTAPDTGLIVDSDGAVLEAAWANVWLVEGDRLVTPPADGRLLPGITRELLLAAGGAAGRAATEAEVDLQRLGRADAVLLTSSIALVTPVGATAAPLAEAVRAALSAASAPSRTSARRAGRERSPARGRSPCS